MLLTMAPPFLRPSVPPTLRAFFVRRASCLVIGLLLSATPLLAQQPFDSARAKAYISVLADDSMRGRLTGSPGALASAQFIAARAKAAGLLPAGDSGTYLQRIPLERPQYSDSSALTIVLGGKRAELRWGKDFVALFGRPGLRGHVGTVWGDLYDVAGIDSTNRSSAGKFILIDVPEGKGLLVQGLPPAAPPAGVIALFSSPRFQSRAARAVLPRRIRYRQAPTDTGGPVILYVDRDSLAARLGPIHEGPAGSPAPFEVSVRIAENVTPVPAWNVVAIRSGEEPGRRHQLVAVGAHYDHLGRTSDPNALCRPKGADSTCNGADDDASGVAATLLAAEALAASKAPARSLLFAWHDATELGALGSAWLVAHPPDGDTIVAEVNLDAVGAARGDTLFQSGAGWLSSALARTVDSVNAALDQPFVWNHVLDDRTGPQIRAACRFDQVSYQRARIPAVLLSAGPTPRFHQADDELSTVDATQVARVGRLAAGIASALAAAPDRPVLDHASDPPVCQ